MTTTIDAMAKPLTIHRVFLRFTKSVTAALLLTDLVERTRTAGRTGHWFPVSHRDWHDTTGLTTKQIVTAKRTLLDLGLIEYDRVGFPAKARVRVVEERLAELVSETANPLETPQFVHNGSHGVSSHGSQPKENRQFVHRRSRNHTGTVDSETPEPVEPQGHDPVDLTQTPGPNTLEIQQFVHTGSSNGDYSILDNTTNVVLEERTGIQKLGSKQRSRFVPPTEEEVAFFFVDTKGMDAAAASNMAGRFVAYYGSNGWKVGKNPMKSWPHAAAGWYLRDSHKGNDHGTQTRPTNQSVRDIADRDRERRKALGLDP